MWRNLSSLVPHNAAAGKPTVEVNDKEYPVETQKKSFYNTMFDKEKKPLCKYTSAPGCESAVAVTSWHFAVDHGLYNAEGVRRPLNTHCDISVLMPNWVNARGKEAKRVQRFLAATKTHEMGHGAACLSVMSIVQELMSHMPPRVHVNEVTKFNSAFAEFVRDYYVVIAHKVDHAYDDLTGHGGTMQGAQLGERDPRASDLDTDTLHELAAHPTRGGRKAGTKSSFLSE